MCRDDLCDGAVIIKNCNLCCIAVCKMNNRIVGFFSGFAGPVANISAFIDPACKLLQRSVLQVFPDTDRCIDDSIAQQMR